MRVAMAIALIVSAFAAGFIFLTTVGGLFSPKLKAIGHARPFASAPPTLLSPPPRHFTIRLPGGIVYHGVGDIDEHSEGTGLRNYSFHTVDGVFVQVLDARNLVIEDVP